jgi:hypothetical protein
VFGRSRFGKLVEMQLDLFVRDHRTELGDVGERLEAYNRADRSDAEELYGDYVDAVDAVADALAAVRDHYAATLDDEGAYVRTFNRAAARRLPDVARELQNR